MSEDIDARTRELEQQLEARDILGLRQLIQLGIEVETFLQSPVGRYMQARAKIELHAATKALRAATPTDAAAVAEAQVRCRVPELVLEWMAEAVAEGQNAATNFINAEAQQG